MQREFAAEPEKRAVSPSNSPVRPRHIKAPSAEIITSREIRPLYLLERNRKSDEISELLPALPASGSPSRASSTTETDADYESALESPRLSSNITPDDRFFDPVNVVSDLIASRPGPEQQHPELAKREIEEIDGSGQVTPKASDFSSGVLTESTGPARDVLAAALEDIKAKDSSTSSHPASPLAPSAPLDDTKMRGIPAARSGDASPTKSSSRLQTAAFGAAIGGLTAAALRNRTPSPFEVLSGGRRLSGEQKRELDFTQAPSAPEDIDIDFDSKGKGKAEPFEKISDAKQFIPTFVDNEDNWSKNKSESIVTNDATLVAEPTSATPVSKEFQTEKVLESTAPQADAGVAVRRAQLEYFVPPAIALKEDLEQTLADIKTELEPVQPTEEEIAPATAKGKKNKKNKRGSQQNETEPSSLPEAPTQDDQILPAPATQQKSIEREILEPSFPAANTGKKVDVMEFLEKDDQPTVRSSEAIPPIEVQIEDPIIELAAPVQEPPNITAKDVEESQAALNEVPQTQELERPTSGWGNSLWGTLGWGKKRATSPTPSLETKTPAAAPAAEERGDLQVPPPPVLPVESNQVEEVPKEIELLAEEEPNREVAAPASEKPSPETTTKSRFIVPQTAYFADSGKPHFDPPQFLFKPIEEPAHDSVDTIAAKNSFDTTPPATITYPTVMPQTTFFTDNGKPHFIFPEPPANDVAETVQMPSATIATKETPEYLPEVTRDVPQEANPTYAMPQTAFFTDNGKPHFIFPEPSTQPAKENADAIAPEPMSVTANDALVAIESTESASSKKKKSKKDKKKRGSVAVPAPETVEAEAPLEHQVEQRLEDRVTDTPAVDQTTVLLREPESVIKPEVVPSLGNDLNAPRAIEDDDVPGQQSEMVADELELSRDIIPTETSTIPEPIAPVLSTPEGDNAASSNKKTKNKKGKKAKRESAQVPALAESEPSTLIVERALNLPSTGPSEAKLDVGIDVPLPIETSQEKDELAEPLSEITGSLPTAIAEKPAVLEDIVAPTTLAVQEGSASIERELPETVPTATEEDTGITSKRKKSKKSKSKSGTQTPETQAGPVTEAPAPTVEPATASREVLDAPKQLEEPSQPAVSEVAELKPSDGVETIVDQERVLGVEPAPTEPVQPIEDVAMLAERTIEAEAATPVSKKEKKKKKGTKAKDAEIPVENIAQPRIPTTIETPVVHVPQPEEIDLPAEVDGELEAPAEGVTAQPQLAAGPRDPIAAQDVALPLENVQVNPQPDIALEPSTRDIGDFAVDAPLQSDAAQAGPAPVIEEQTLTPVIVQPTDTTAQDESAVPTSSKKDKKKKKGKKGKAVDDSEPSTPLTELQREIEISLEPTKPNPLIEAPLPSPKRQVEVIAQAEPAVDVASAAKDQPIEASSPAQTEPVTDVPIVALDEAVKALPPPLEEVTATPKKAKKKKSKQGKSVDTEPTTTDLPEAMPETTIEPTIEPAINDPIVEPATAAPNEEPREIPLPQETPGELVSEPLEAARESRDYPVPIVAELKLGTDHPIIEEEPVTTSKKSKKNKANKGKSVDPEPSTPSSEEPSINFESPGEPTEPPVVEKKADVLEVLQQAPVVEETPLPEQIESTPEPAPASRASNGPLPTAAEEPAQDSGVSTAIEATVETEDAELTSRKVKKKKAKKAKKANSTDITEPSTPVTEESSMQFEALVGPATEGPAIGDAPLPADVEALTESTVKTEEGTTLPATEAQVQDLTEPTTLLEPIAEMEATEPASEKAKKKKGKKAKAVEEKESDSNGEPVASVPAAVAPDDAQRVEEVAQLSEPLLTETPLEPPTRLDEPLPTPITADPVERELATEIGQLSEPVDFEVAMKNPVGEPEILPERSLSTEPVTIQPEEPTEIDEAISTSKKTKKKKKGKKDNSISEPHTPAIEVDSFIPAASAVDDIKATSTAVQEFVDERDIQDAVPEILPHAAETKEVEQIATEPLESVQVIEEPIRDNEASSAAPYQFVEQGDKETTDALQLKKDKKKAKKSKRVSIVEDSASTPATPVEELSRELEPREIAASVPLPEATTISEPVSSKSMPIDVSQQEPNLPAMTLDDSNISHPPVNTNTERTADSQEGSVLEVENALASSEQTQPSGEETISSKKSKKKAKKDKRKSAIDSEPSTSLETPTQELERAPLDDQRTSVPEFVAETKDEAISAVVDVQPATVIVEPARATSTVIEALQEEQPVAEPVVTDEPQQLEQGADIEQTPLSKKDKKKAKKSKRVSIAEPESSRATPTEEKELSIEDQTVPVAQPSEPSRDEAVSSSVVVQPITSSDTVPKPKALIADVALEETPQPIAAVPGEDPQSQEAPEEESATVSKKDKKKAKQAKRVSIAEPEHVSTTPGEERPEMELPLDGSQLPTPIAVEEVIPKIAPLEQLVSIELPANESAPVPPAVEQPSSTQAPVEQAPTTPIEEATSFPLSKKDKKKIKRGSAAENGIGSPIETSTEQNSQNSLDVQHSLPIPVVEEQVQEPVSVLRAVEEVSNDVEKDESATTTKKDKKKAKKAAERVSVAEPGFSEPSTSIEQSAQESTDVTNPDRPAVVASDLNEPLILAPAGEQPAVGLTETAEPESVEPVAKQTKDVSVEDKSLATPPVNKEPTVVTPSETPPEAAPTATEEVAKAGAQEEVTSASLLKKDKKKAKKLKRGSVAEPAPSEAAVPVEEAAEQSKDVGVTEEPVTAAPTDEQKLQDQPTEEQVVPSQTIEEHKEGQQIGADIPQLPSGLAEEPSITESSTVEATSTSTKEELIPSDTAIVPAIPTIEEPKNDEAEPAEWANLSKAQKKKLKKAKRASVAGNEHSQPVTPAEELPRELAFETEQSLPQAVDTAEPPPTPIIQEPSVVAEQPGPSATVPEATLETSVEASVDAPNEPIVKSKNNKKKAKGASGIEDQLSLPATSVEEAVQKLEIQDQPAPPARIEEPAIAERPVAYDTPPPGEAIEQASAAVAPIAPVDESTKTSKKDKKKAKKQQKQSATEIVPFLALETPEEANVSDTQSSPPPSIPSETPLLLSGIPTSYPHVCDIAFVENVGEKENERVVQEERAEEVPQGEVVVANEKEKELMADVEQLVVAIGKQDDEPVVEDVDVGTSKKNKKDKKGGKRVSVAEGPAPEAATAIDVADTTTVEPPAREQVEPLTEVVTTHPEVVLPEQPFEQTEVAKTQIPETQTTKESKVMPKGSDVAIPTEPEQKKVRKHKLAALFEQKAAEEKPIPSQKRAPLAKPVLQTEAVEPKGDSSKAAKLKEDVTTVQSDPVVSTAESEKPPEETDLPPDVVVEPMVTEPKTPEDVIEKPIEAMRTVEPAEELPSLPIAEASSPMEDVPDDENSVSKKDKKTKKTKKSKKQSGTTTSVEAASEVQLLPMKESLAANIKEAESEVTLAVKHKAPFEAKEQLQEVSADVQLQPTAPIEPTEVIPDEPQEKSVEVRTPSVSQAAMEDEAIIAPSKKDKKKNKRAQKQSGNATPAEEAVPEIRQEQVEELSVPKSEQTDVEAITEPASPWQQPPVLPQDEPEPTSNDKTMEALCEEALPTAVKPLTEVLQQEAEQPSSNASIEAAEHVADDIGGKPAKKDKKKATKAKTVSRVDTPVTEDVPEVGLKIIEETTIEQIARAASVQDPETEQVIEPAVEPLVERTQPATVGKFIEAPQQDLELAIASEVNPDTQADILVAPETITEPARPAEEDWGYTPPKKDKKNSKKNKKADVMERPVEAAPELPVETTHPTMTPTMETVEDAQKPVDAEVVLDSAHLDSKADEMLPVRDLVDIKADDYVSKELGTERVPDIAATDITETVPFPSSIQPGKAALEEEASAPISKKDKKKAKKAKKASGTATLITEELPAIRSEPIQGLGVDQVSTSMEPIEEAPVIVPSEAVIVEQPREPESVESILPLLTGPESSVEEHVPMCSPKEAKELTTVTPVTEEAHVPQAEAIHESKVDTTDSNEVKLDDKLVAVSDEIQENRDIERLVSEPEPVTASDPSLELSEATTAPKKKSKKKSKKSGVATPTTEDVPAPETELTQELEVQAEVPVAPAVTDFLTTDDRQVTVKDVSIPTAQVDPAFEQQQRTEKVETTVTRQVMDAETPVEDQPLPSTSKKGKNKAKSGTATLVVDDVPETQQETVQEPEATPIVIANLNTITTKPPHDVELVETRHLPEADVSTTPTAVNIATQRMETALPATSSKKSKKGRKSSTATPTSEDILQNPSEDVLLPINEASTTNRNIHASEEQVVEVPARQGDEVTTAEPTIIAELDVAAPVQQIVNFGPEARDTTAPESIIAPENEAENLESSSSKKKKKNKGKKSEPQTPAVELSDPIETEIRTITNDVQEGPAVDNTEVVDRAPLLEATAIHDGTPAQPQEKALAEEKPTLGLKLSKKEKKALKEAAAKDMDAEPIAETETPIENVLEAMPVHEHEPVLVKDCRQLPIQDAPPMPALVVEPEIARDTPETQTMNDVVAVASADDQSQAMIVQDEFALASTKGKKAKKDKKSKKQSVSLDEVEAAVTAPSGRIEQTEDFLNPLEPDIKAASTRDLKPSLPTSDKNAGQLLVEPLVEIAPTREPSTEVQEDVEQKIEQHAAPVESESTVQPLNEKTNEPVTSKGIEPAEAAPPLSRKASKKSKKGKSDEDAMTSEPTSTIEQLDTSLSAEPVEENSSSETKEPKMPTHLKSTEQEIAFEPATIILPAYEINTESVSQPIESELQTSPSTFETVSQTTINIQTLNDVQPMQEDGSETTAISKRSRKDKKKGKKSGPTSVIATPIEVVSEPAVASDNGINEYSQPTPSEESPGDTEPIEPQVAGTEFPVNTETPGEVSSTPIVEIIQDNILPTQESAQELEQQPIEDNEPDSSTSSASKKGKKKRSKKVQNVVDEIEAEPTSSATLTSEVPLLVAQEPPIEEAETLPTITEASFEAKQSPTLPSFETLQEASQPLHGVPPLDTSVEPSSDQTDQVLEQQEKKEEIAQPPISLSPDLRAVQDEAADFRLRSEALDQALASSEQLVKPSASEPTSFFDIVGKLSKKDKRKGKKAKGVAFDPESTTPAAELEAAVEAKELVEELAMDEVPERKRSKKDKKKVKQSVLSADEPSVAFAEAHAPAIESQAPIIEQTREDMDIVTESAVHSEAPVVSVDEVVPTPLEEPVVTIANTSTTTKGTSHPGDTPMLAAETAFPIGSTETQAVHGPLATTATEPETQGPTIEERPSMSRKLSKKDKNKQAKSAFLVEDEATSKPQIVQPEKATETRELTSSEEPLVAEPVHISEKPPDARSIPEVQETVVETNRPSLSREQSKKDKKKAKQASVPINPVKSGVKTTTATDLPNPSAEVMAEVAQTHSVSHAPAVHPESIDKHLEDQGVERDVAVEALNTTTADVPVSTASLDSQEMRETEEPVAPEGEVMTAPTLTRKQSKKDRKKGKKSVLASEPTEFEGAQTAAIEDGLRMIDLPADAADPPIDTTRDTLTTAVKNVQRDIPAHAEGPAQAVDSRDIVDVVDASVPEERNVTVVDSRKSKKDKAKATPREEIVEEQASVEHDTVPELAPVVGAENVAEDEWALSAKKSKKEKPKSKTTVPPEPSLETESASVSRGVTQEVVSVQRKQESVKDFVSKPELAESDSAYKALKKEKRKSQKTAPAYEEEPATPLESEARNIEDRVLEQPPTTKPDANIVLDTEAAVDKSSTIFKSAATAHNLEANEPPILARKPSRTHKLAALFEQGASQEGSAAQRELRKEGTGSVKNLAEQFETQSGSVTPVQLPISRERSISRVTSEARLRPETPKKDIDFAGTIAAGLKASGFDDKYVVNDSTFHQSTSPGSTRDMTTDDDVAAALEGASASKFATRGWTTPTSSPKLRPTKESDSDTLPPIEVAIASTDNASFDPLDVLNDPTFSKRNTSPGILEEVDPDELGSKFKLNKKSKGKKKRASLPKSPAETLPIDLRSEPTDTASRSLDPEQLPMPLEDAEDAEDDTWSTEGKKSKKSKKDEKRATLTQERVEYAAAKTPAVETLAREHPAVETVAADSTTRESKLEKTLPPNVDTLGRSVLGELPTMGKELGEYPFPQVVAPENTGSRIVEELVIREGEEQRERVEDGNLPSKKKSKKSRKGKEKSETATEAGRDGGHLRSFGEAQDPAHETHKRRSHPVTFEEDQPYEKRPHLREATPETRTSLPGTSALAVESKSQGISPSGEPTWSFAGVRDSAVEVNDSTVQASVPTFQESTRDSGYHDAGHSPVMPQEQAQQEGTSSREKKRRSKESKTPREKAIRNSQDIENRPAHPDYPTSAGVTTPLAQDYATKERTSYLFDSSPSTRAYGTSPVVESATPAHESRRAGASSAGEVSKATDTDRKLHAESRDEQVSLTKEVEQKGSYQPIFSDPSEKTTESSSSLVTPLSKHGRTPSNKHLHTITETSPDDSPLHKKTRAINDVGAPDRGTKSARQTESPRPFSERLKSPPPVTPTPLSRKGVPSAVDVTGRHSPSIDSPWHQVHDKVDRTMTLSPARRLPRSSPSFDPIKQHMAEQRSPSALSQRSMSNISKLRSPDQEQRPLSSASNRSTHSLRRVDRSASGDLRSVARLGEEASAQDANYAEPNLSGIALATGATAAIAGVAAASKYDPVRGAGKGRRASMAAETFVSVRT